LNDVEIQENLCFVGGIPIITKFAARQYSNEIRLEAAAFVRQMYQTSTLTLQMFVSAGGLNVLVEFLDEDYDEARDLVLIGVNGIWNVFELQVNIHIKLSNLVIKFLNFVGTYSKKRLLSHFFTEQDFVSISTCSRACPRRKERQAFGTHRRSYCEHILFIFTGRELCKGSCSRQSRFKA